VIESRAIFADLPDSFWCRSAAFGMSILAKYMIVIMPECLTNDFFDVLLSFFPQFMRPDQDLLVTLVSRRLTLQQRQIAISKFPGCSATYIFLGRCLMDSALFRDSFSRIASCFDSISTVCRRHIASLLKVSLKLGLASPFVVPVLELSVRNDRLFRVVMDAIWFASPESLGGLDFQSLQSAFCLMMRPATIPRSVLEVRLLTDGWSPLIRSQILYLLEAAPDSLFRYVERSGDQVDFWSLLLASLDGITAEALAVLLGHFYRALTRITSIHAVVQAADLFGWFARFLHTMSLRPSDLAIFAICMLILRNFDDLAVLSFESSVFVPEMQRAIAEFKGCCAFAELYFWIMDSRRPCPFQVMLQEILHRPGSPSSCFVFQLHPGILGDIVKASMTKTSETTIGWISKNLCDMYDDDKLCCLLFPLSAPDVLRPVVAAAKNDADCRRFVYRALGLSCQFSIFKMIFESIRHDLKQTIEFLSEVAN
jgi:hypothetical protein